MKVEKKIYIKERGVCMIYVLCIHCILYVHISSTYVKNKMFYGIKNYNTTHKLYKW